MSFAELRRSPSFLAVVESKMHGVWGIQTDSSTGKPPRRAKPTEYVIVYLRREDGKTIGILQPDPTPNEVMFVSKLRDGDRYSFPAILQMRGPNP